MSDSVIRRLNECASGGAASAEYESSATLVFTYGGRILLDAPDVVDDEDADVVANPAIDFIVPADTG